MDRKLAAGFDWISLGAALRRSRLVPDVERIRESLQRAMREAFPHLLMAVVFRPEAR